MSEKICIVGSGNWGSTVAKIVGENVEQRLSSRYGALTMWVFDEMYEGTPLATIINERRENVRYLPGVKLPAVVHATSDAREAVRGASVIIFVLPQQFLESTCARIRDDVREGAVAVSLIKGITYDDNTRELVPLSTRIAKMLPNLSAVGALMGANIADEVARELFSEATISVARIPSTDTETNTTDPNRLPRLPPLPPLREIFDRPYFRVTQVDDLVGVEICGVLKNIVAIAAGVVDGLAWGSNAKAAVIRIGVAEIRAFAMEFFDNVRESTFFESCGIADVITTCYGGRHRMIGEALARAPRGTHVTDLEAKLLNGQKLQGTVAVCQIYEMMEARGVSARFPLFRTVYRILYKNLDPSKVVEDL